MSSSNKKTKTTAPKKAVAVASVNTIVEVKNISTRLINTTQGPIEAGELGKSTIAELRQLGKFLEKV